MRVLDRATGDDKVWTVIPGATNFVAWDLAISPDGQSLLLDYTNSRANLWMLENFK